MGNADAHPSAGNLRNILQLLLELLLDIEHPSGFLDVLLACKRQLNGIDRPVKQENAQLLFHLADIAAERRLRHVQLIGGLGDAAAFRNLQDVLQLSEIHAAFLLSLSGLPAFYDSAIPVFRQYPSMPGFAHGPIGPATGVSLRFAPYRSVSKTIFSPSGVSKYSSGSKAMPSVSVLIICAFGR